MHFLNLTETVNRIFFCFKGVIDDIQTQHVTFHLNLYIALPLKGH